MNILHITYYVPCNNELPRVNIIILINITPVQLYHFWIEKSERGSQSQDPTRYETACITIDPGIVGVPTKTLGDSRENWPQTQGEHEREREDRFALETGIFLLPFR